MRSNMYLDDSLYQISNEIESLKDIDYIIAYNKITSDTQERYQIKPSKFSFFISTLQANSESTTIITQGLESSTKPIFKPINKSEFINKHKDIFAKILKTDNVEEDGISAAEQYFNILLEEDKDGAIKLIQDLFTSTLTCAHSEENLQVGILKLLCAYDLKDIGSSAILIAASAYSIRSIKVKSATFDLLGHWASIDTYNLLKKYDEPQEPWLKMKYKALLHSLEMKYYAVH